MNYDAWFELSTLNRVYSTASIAYNDALMLTTPGGTKEEIVEIATLLNDLVRNIPPHITSTLYEII